MCEKGASSGCRHIGTLLVVGRVVGVGRGVGDVVVREERWGGRIGLLHKSGNGDPCWMRMKGKIETDMRCR